MRFLGTFLILILTTLVFNQTLPAQVSEVVEITDIRFNQIKVMGFRLEEDRTLKIEGVGSGIEHAPKKVRSLMVDPNGMFAYAWILDAHTREMVWQMTAENTRSGANGIYTRIYKGEIELPAGDYEVYFSAQKPNLISIKDGFFSLGKILERLIKGKENFWKNEEEKWRILIRGVDEVLTQKDVEKYHRILKKQSIVSINNLKDLDFRQQGFSLKKSGEFEIYAIGEAYQGEEFDYGWIVRTDQADKIWESLYEKGQYAGGAIKNRVWRTRIQLSPGEYWVYFVTDDSHSPEKWNANPPYDPFFWGITLKGVPGKFSPESVKPLTESKIEPIVSITRVGNDERVRQYFQLNKPTKVRILAIGEGRDDEMFDYGWIINLDTNEKVWKMRYENTRHAGGADKNRMEEKIIKLPAGRYEVVYVTDDSHAYQHWNASPPYNPRLWGITIFPAEPGFSRENVQKISMKPGEKDVLVKIVEVGDNEHIRKILNLNRKTTIRIYALGEGSWDEMFDYAWIEDDNTGDVVWRMEYDNTRWAGGARKNRKIDDVITLPAGRYTVHYVTDDSHSFDNWNAEPPDEPSAYGITIYKLPKEGN